MHNQAMITELFKEVFPSIHQKRAESLINISTSLLNGGSLTVSSLGRHLSGNALEKSRIHRADSIVGNGLLNRDKLLIERLLVNHFFSVRPILYVLIDGSGCCSDERYILQASIANSGLGRSQPIHSVVYTNTKNALIAAQEELLRDLQFIFADIQAQIVLVTDAGFYPSWFNQVSALGWDYVGRVRGTIKIQREGTEEWATVQELYAHATQKAHCLGRAKLGKDRKSTRGNGVLFLIKNIKKGRKKPLSKKKYPDQEKQYEQMYKDPWLLISSIDTPIPSNIVMIYSLRMQIEQNFRDLKNNHHGFGLEDSGTKDLMRLSNLLLIATVALFIALLIGLAGEQNKIHLKYQANTIKNRRVLSLIYLGIRIWQTDVSQVIPYIKPLYTTKI